MNGVDWTLGGNTSNDFAGGAALNSGKLTLDIDDGGSTSIAGVVSGPGSLTKDGI